MKHGQLPFNVDASTRAVARGLGQLPKGKPQLQVLTLRPTFWGTAQCHFPAWPGMWLSLKKRAKGWQGRLEGFKKFPQSLKNAKIAQ